MENILWVENILDNQAFDEDILDLKKEVAKDIIEKKVKTNVSGVSKLLVGKGVSLEEYLVADTTGKKILNTVKGKVLDKVFDSLTGQKFVIDGKEYSSVFEYLEPIKESLDMAKTEAEIQALKHNIFQQTEEYANKKHISTESWGDIGVRTIEYSTVPAFVVYKNLKATGNISQEDVQYVNTQAKYTIDRLKTVGGLIDISEVTNQQWEKIIKWTWRTPYIHKKAAADLIWVALLFHKKTKKPLILSSAYRTIEHQQELKKQNAKKNIPTADPGYSAHNLWLAIDIEKWSRYNTTIWWIAVVRKVMKMFNFSPIESEDRHFEHKEFDNYREDREKRLALAQTMQKKYYEDVALSQVA